MHPITLTLCIDTSKPRPRGIHVNRWGKQLRSVRVYASVIAIGYYRMDDWNLVAHRHAWED